MTRTSTITYEFVEHIPDALQDGTLYISIPFATVVHQCCCGCGNEVVTPLTPTDWSLTFDGEAISLDPSIGNWSFPCQSHYWIISNRVEWARQWSKQEIAAGRAHDQSTKARHYQPARPAKDDTVGFSPSQRKQTKTFWRRLRKWF